MPCNCDHLKASQWEKALSKVAAILDELETGKLNKIHYRGYHPAIYNKHIDKATADKLTDNLCGMLQNRDVTTLSLEAQIWWRDHQEADAARLRLEAEEHSREALRKAAMYKLTPEDREVLGL